ncbi:MAG: pilus assembly protein PilM [Clostridium sp.]|uniref:pilus assembly protein PilM n=1 Tax=Clostridium sp. TaxID=1506 RepID=UPI00304E6531
MGLFSKDKVKEQQELNIKEIDLNMGLETDGELLNREGYRKGLKVSEKKESIWNQELKLKDLSFKKIFSGGGANTRVRVIKPKSVRLMAIDIGSSEIKIVEGQVKNGKIKVYNMEKVKSPKDIIEDGNIYNEDSVSIRIKDVMSKSNVKTKNVAIVSSSSTIISRELIVPYVENYNELSNLVHYEIERFLAINLNNYVIQFMRLEEIIVDNLRKQKLFAIIYPKNIIDNYRNLTHSLLMNPYSLDITNNSIKKIKNMATVYNSDLIDKNECAMYLDMGNRTIDISIVNRENLEFIRIMPVGGSEITNYIVSCEHVSIEDAEKIKATKVDVGINRPGNELNNGVADIIDDWLADLNRIIQFYTNKSNGKKIKHIYLYGGTSKLKGIDEHIAFRTEIDAIKIRTIDNIEFNNSANTRTVEEYINALGALIRL